MSNTEQTHTSTPKIMTTSQVIELLEKECNREGLSKKETSKRISEQQQKFEEYSNKSIKEFNDKIKLIELDIKALEIKIDSKEGQNYFDTINNPIKKPWFQAFQIGDQLKKNKGVIKKERKSSMSLEEMAGEKEKCKKEARKIEGTIAYFESKLNMGREEYSKKLKELKAPDLPPRKDRLEKNDPAKVSENTNNSGRSSIPLPPPRRRPQRKENVFFPTVPTVKKGKNLEYYNALNTEKGLRGFQEKTSNAKTKRTQNGKKRTGRS